MGEGVFIQTLEAKPEGLSPPIIKEAGAKVLEVYWSPPSNPNGLITSYHIYRYYTPHNILQTHQSRATSSKSGILNFKMNYLSYLSVN